MTLDSFYRKVGGDINDILESISSEKLIKKYIYRFREVTCFQDLQRELQQQNLQKAFEAAHALKGVCASIGFQDLWMAAAELTEILRPQNAGVYSEQELQRAIESTEQAYKQTMCAIELLIREEMEK